MLSKVLGARVLLGRKGEKGPRGRCVVHGGRLLGRGLMLVEAVCHGSVEGTTGRFQMETEARVGGAA